MYGMQSNSCEISHLRNQIIKEISWSMPLVRCVPFLYYKVYIERSL